MLHALLMAIGQLLRGFKASRPAHKLSIEASVLALLIAAGNDPCFVNPQ